MKLYAGGLPFNMTESDLNELFAPFGTVVSANIVTDRYSGQSKGFAFVEMSSRSEGHKAMEGMNGKSVNHRTLVVNEAKPPKKKGAHRW